jgi:polyisoprenoid-binding protein YceI
MSHHSKISILLIGIALLVILVTGCSPAVTQTPPPANGNQVPDTGPTSTNSPTVNAAPATETPAAAASSPTTVSPGAGLKYVLVPSKSEASYQVREQLARRDFPNDAVGKTSAIEGSITINPDGNVDQANSKFTVDLSTLKSDENMRDNYVRRSILKTDQNPQAVFIPTKISGLPAEIPQSGSVSFQVTGDLTINKVTKTVTWDVTGTNSGGEATGAATTSFTFKDFNLNQPQVPVVLSVVDKITLNVTVTLQREGD